MRTRGLGPWWAAVLVGSLFGAVAAAADEDAAPKPNEPPPKAADWPDQKGLMSHFFKSRSSQPTAKDLAATNTTSLKEAQMPEHEDPKEMASAERKTEAGKALKELAREQDTLLRRLAVCDQLKLVATQNRDDALFHQAEQLEQRAQALYAQRVAHLPASQALTGTPSAAAAPAARSSPSAARKTGKSAPTSLKDEEKP